VAVKGIEYFVLHLTDGIAIENATLDLLFKLFRCQGDRLLTNERERAETEKKEYYYYVA
jgi:hypothetical protein